jgi:hypothetical protein
MSAAPIENVVMAAVSTVETKPKREKKPSLPAKLQKFASTMYFILQTFNEQGLISDEDLERGIVENHLFDHVDNLQQQTVVLEALLDQQPAALKSFRKTATARNKPPKAPKAPKEKKEKAPKAPKEPKEKKEKAPRAKKEKAVSVAPAQEPVQEELVAAPEEQEEEEPAAAPVVTKTKKARAVKPVKAAVAEVEAEVEVEVVAEVVEEKKVVKEPKEKKEKKEKVVKEKVVKEPKEKATKKTKNSPRVTSDAADDLIGQIVAAARATPPPLEVEEEEDDEIHTREFSHQGTVYLIDDENSIYSYSTHEHIGSFDPLAQTISLL